MGYTTDFIGSFTITPPLPQRLKEEMQTFSETRRCSPQDYNRPPEGQPGLWCNWTPNDEGTELIWNEAEKFYYYVEWLEYLIEHFLKPNGHTLSGEVLWKGEDRDDMGKIIVNDNVVTAKAARITYED